MSARNEDLSVEPDYVTPLLGLGVGGVAGLVPSAYFATAATAMVSDNRLVDALALTSNAGLGIASVGLFLGGIACMGGEGGKSMMAGFTAVAFVGALASDRLIVQPHERAAIVMAANDINSCATVNYDMSFPGMKPSC